MCGHTKLMFDCEQCRASIGKIYESKTDWELDKISKMCSSMQSAIEDNEVPDNICDALAGLVDTIEKSVENIKNERTCGDNKTNFMFSNKY